MGRPRKWNVEEVFENRRATEYGLKTDALWSEVLVARDSLFVLQKVMDFPSDLLLRPEQYRFLDLVKRHFMLESTRVLVRILSEDDPHSLTLPKLKNWIVQNCSAPVRQRLAAELDRRAGPKQVRNLHRQALRVHQDAKLRIDHVLDPRVRHEAAGTLREIQSLLAGVDKLCRALCIGRPLDAGSVPYSPFVRHSPRLDSKSDIERILHHLASESPVLRMPEDRPDAWLQYRKRLTPGERRSFNEWRKKLGRVEVEF